jgi:hypothetical protein
VKTRIDHPLLPTSRPRRLAMAIAAVVALVLTLVVVTQRPQAAAAQESVFDDSTTPVVITDPDSNAVELGVTFSSSVDISVTGIRFYKGPENTGRHVGTLWNSDRTAVSKVVFTDETESGWQTAAFETPVDVAAGETFVASYVAPQGRYSADTQGFDASVTDGTVTFPAGAGVYTYRAGRFPARTFDNSNYFVDIVYERVGESAPSLEPTAPAADAPDPQTDRPNSAPSESALLDLPRETWWGGPDYYAQFSKADAAGWDKPSFFPISVFYGKPEHAKALAKLGVNTYMGAEHDGSDIGTITREGISVIAQQEWTPSELGDDPRVVGWHVSDECEMGLGECQGAPEEEDRLQLQRQFVDEARSHDDGRFVQANFGNGVLGTYWAPTTMDDQLGLIDVSSVDKYAYSSPHVQDLLPGSPSWPADKAPASAGAYGWLQDEMETFSSPAASKPNWVFVETGMPYLTEDDATSISGHQIEGAVWNGIIHGAAGIAYFQHNNNGCGNYSLVECGSKLQATVKALDAEVKSLAPAINTQPYAWSFGPELETSLRVQGGFAYIFAMTDGSTGDRAFTLPTGLRGDIDVVGEDRTLRAAGGSFTDSFPSEYTHHIYRIALR